MKKIRYCILFSDLMQDFTGIRDYLKKLQEKYVLIETYDNPEYVFFFENNIDFLKYKNAIRIFWCAENVQPNFALCDYAIGNCRLEYADRYFRYPYYMLPKIRYLFKHAINKKKLEKSDLITKKYFCNFIYGNAKCDTFRTEFFNVLSSYKFIHSAGQLLNNTFQVPKGKNWTETFDLKVQYQKQFKFTIAFENTSAYGYISEKIVNAFQAQTIPIYWGDPLVEKSFNGESFINCHKYNTLDEVIDRIIELDNDDEKYLNTINQGISGSEIKHDEEILDNDFLAFLDHIFSCGKIWRNYVVKQYDFREEKRYEKGVYKYEERVKIYNKTIEIANFITPKKIKNISKNFFKKAKKNK